MINRKRINKEKTGFNQMLRKTHYVQERMKERQEWKSSKLIKSLKKTDKNLSVEGQSERSERDSDDEGVASIRENKM